MGLYESDKYLADVEFLVATKIREYDLKSAGFNLTKEFKLLSKKKIEFLSTLDKKQRTIQIGLYMREDKEYNKALTAAFKKARKMFFKANDIKPEHVLSIKKDAIFLINKVASVQKFGDYIFFDTKNTYTSYHNINGFEFYANARTLDIKGISDEVIERYHRDYLVNFIHTCIKFIEKDQIKPLRRYLKKFVRDYKSLDLHVGYYRELTSKSEYSLDLPGSDCIYYLEEMNSDGIKYTNIGYNYINYILYFIKNFM